MKNRVFTLLLLALMTACGGRGSSSAASPQEQPDGVEVLSFHTKKRCPTCRAIEQLTREVVEQEFADEAADGTLRLHVAEITEEEELAVRYEVAWSSLLLSHRHNGEEPVVDLTRFAFAHARTDADLFRRELKARIEQLLAQ